MMFRLDCRIDSCQVRDYFDSAEQINNSGWDSINKISGIGGQKNGDTVYRHIGYCPRHNR